MRIAAGIVMIIVAALCAVIGFLTLLNQPAPFVFMRALPALLILLLGVLLAFGAYRVLKGRK
jgi:hypothetical protein